MKDEDVAKLIAWIRTYDSVVKDQKGTARDSVSKAYALGVTEALNNVILQIEIYQFQESIKELRHEYVTKPADELTI